MREAGGTGLGSTRALNWARHNVDRARDAAYRCVAAVEREGAYANLVMATIVAEAGLGTRDAAFATELAYGTLRMQGLYDAIIADAARRDVDAIDEGVRWALWLGVHQAIAMRVPPHAAVSETVDLVRSRVEPRAAAFANAVMRRVTERNKDAWLARVAGGTGREALAVRTSHPVWVVSELEKALAADGRPGTVAALLDADNVPAAVTLVARPGLVDRNVLAREVGGSATQLSPYGVRLDGGTPGAFASVREGRAAVQDEGSQLVAAALVAARPVAGRESWLDMCAGPGGKTALLGSLAAPTGSTVDALEVHEHRAKLVRDAVRALPEGVVRVRVGDARTDVPASSYDRVLLDAPCTGLGALRRRPEARWRRTEAELDELTSLQRQLLASAARAVRPGGLVAYVTCSPVLAETTAIVAGEHGLIPVDSRPAMDAVAGSEGREWGRGPWVQLWTHIHSTDAMFLAILTRPE